MTVTNYVATCRTPDCENNGIAVDIVYDDLNGEMPPTPGVIMCGACGQEITDVTMGPAPAP